MINRLLLHWQLRLLALVCLIPWATNIQAQCPDTLGVFATFEPNGTNVVYLGPSCSAPFDNAPNGIGVVPLPGSPSGSLLFDSMLTGYNNGNMVNAQDTINVYWRWMTGSGTDTFCFQVFFIDTLPPVFNYTVADGSADCSTADYTAWWEAQLDSVILHASDGCGIDTAFHTGADTVAENCGTFLDTFIVVDNSGNIAFQAASYLISDNAAPTLVGVPADLALSCADPIPAPATVTATDCPGVAVVVLFKADTIANATGACGEFNFTINRIWTASDGCGNISRDTQSIVVQDVVDPDFDIPADTVVNCGTPVDTLTLGSYSNVTDNCAADFTITMTDVVTPGTCGQEQTIVRTWTVTDPCSNSTTQSQTITVQDTIAPTANFPADITVDCADAGNLNVTGQPVTIADNCDTAAFVTQLPDVVVAGSCDYSYTIQRTWQLADACGNSFDSLQIITVEDKKAPVATQAQNQSIACDDAINADNVFAAWVTAHGNATASDNCTPTLDLVWEAYNAGTNTAASLAAPNCANPTLGVYRTRTVDFVVTDKCGNRDTTTATFTVTDTQAPVLVNCPTDQTLENDPGFCDATRTMPLPLVTEECGNTASVQSFSLTQPLTYPGGDPVETPVDSVVFNFAAPAPPFVATSNATLKISLNNVDAEEPTEFFMAYGENGVVLGPLAHTPTQCGDTMTTFTLTAAQVNDWAFDGNLRITVKPNVPINQPGRFSVNPICPNGSLTGDLSYNAEFPSNLKFEYTLNADPRVQVDPVGPVTLTFGQGLNSVNYYFTDCAGNEASCSFEITVEDKEAPVIDCPASFSVNLDSGQCVKDVLVPLFSSITDNCGVTTPTTQTQPADPNDRLLTFTYNPNLTDYLADDKMFVFSGLQGNATPGGVNLILTFQADVDSVGEYFEIYDNDGNLLGTTAKGQSHVVAGDCNTPSTATFSIPATTFNDWASAGDITIRAVSYMGYPIPPATTGWGINPCDAGMVNANGDTDGSFIYATFSYQSVSPVFSALGATSIDPITLNPPLEAEIYSLDQGTTTFAYQVTDLAGNLGECSFDITVVDAEAPKALCGPTFVDINPSGIVNETILPDDIDLGSSDNCTIASITVTPNMVTCSDALTNPNTVTLTITDQAGNVSTCNTFVNVTVTGPAPSVSTTCGSNTLSLFANPPAAPGGGSNPYQFTWFTPQGQPFAYVQNPTIQDADQGDLGFYNVVIEGLTGCQAVGSVQVTCDALPLQKPTLQAADNTVCTNESIELTTASVCGSSIVYKWYSGNAPGVLLGTTSQPTYSMTPPASGMFTFYVVVSRNGCDSAPSDAINVQVNSTPTAMPSPTSFVLCEGEDILLNAINNANGSTCHWTGPCGYESFSCSPAPIDNSALCNSGIYQLTVTTNGCESDPASVTVTVVAQPAQPLVTNTTSSSNPACDGESITLTATNVPGAVSYLWTTPAFTTISTIDNVLVIPSVDITKDAGNWTVKVIGNPCESDVSAPTTVYIVPAPEAISAAASPSQACEGQSVQLSASSASQNVSFLWTYPNGQTNALPNPVLNNVGNNSEGTYTLAVTNQFGCSVSTTVVLDVINRVNITGISSDAPTCASGPVNVHLVATLFPMDNGTYQYHWTGPNYSSVNASATIPNATLANSGTYTLVVTNAQGCSSLPATVNVAIPEVIPTPGPPTGIINPYCEGDELTITTTAYPGASNNAAYVWTTPSGIYTTSTPSLTLMGLTVTDSGPYTVKYLLNDCPSATSGSVNVTVNPAPVIQPVSNSPVCEGQTLQLSVSCSPGSSYEWTGPTAFSSSVCNPVVPNTDPALHAGTYTVRKKENGCWSDVVPVNVTINEKPAVPTAINAGPYCANTDNVMLSVTANSATPGASYTWYDSAGQPLGAATPSLNFAVPNPMQYGNGSVEFYVVASQNGCTSTPSVPTVVLLNTVPSNQAEAGADLLICEDQIVELQATVPSVGTGFWTVTGGNPNGVTIANPDEATTTVSGLIPGQPYVFQWALSNGACENYSSDQANVYVDILEYADAGDPITACFTNTVNLNATVPVSNIGVWTQPAAQASLGVAIVDPSDPASLVTGLLPGNSYVFTWTIDGGCGTSSDAVLVTASNETAYAGDDFVACGNVVERCATLDAVPSVSNTGSWSSPDGQLSFATPTDFNTPVCGLKPGENVLVWTINGGICDHFSVDSVIVTFRILELEDDVISVLFGREETASLTFNDNITGTFLIEILQQPEHGELALNAAGEITYQPDVNYIGQDMALYQVCQDDCDCKTATITFNVGENAGCDVPSIITPNDDGVNDAFVIPCIANGDRFPNSTVAIFNQWGDEVFHAEPYENNWEGTFDGEDLPAGTYFYFIDLGNGEAPLSGYVIIQR